MTTTVRVLAHCAEDERVRVTVMDGADRMEELYLKDGEEAERYIHGDYEITVREMAVATSRGE